MHRVQNVQSLSVPQPSIEEKVNTSASTSSKKEHVSNNKDDEMPVIHRFDNATLPATTTAPPTTSRSHIIINQRTGQTSGKVLLIRRNDGTTQFLRPVINSRSDTAVNSGPASAAVSSTTNPIRRVITSVGSRSGTVVKTMPTRVVRFGTGGQQIMTTIPTGSRILRIPGSDSQMTNRHPAQRSFFEETSSNVTRKVQISRSIPHVINRGGATMAMGQRIAQSDYRVPPGRTIRRGYSDYMRVSSFPSRAYKFDFESNEDEERAIAEAIEKEEERMRMEEEENRRDQEKQWNHPRIIDKYGQIGSNMLQQLSKQPLQFSSNLMPSKEDTPDLKQIKQTLDSLITQVCRWDKQYGWFKAHQRKPKLRGIEVDKIKTRRHFSNQRELMVADHVDRLRREINKRRTRLENNAENMCGLPTPWRKNKTKANKSKSRTQAQDQKKNDSRPKVSIVNPAEISLGDGSINWVKKELKDDDELVEDLSQSSLKKVKLEVREDSRRKLPGTIKSDRILRTRINSHSSIEERMEPPRKRGRPRKEQLASTQSDDSDGGYDYGIPDGMTNPNDPHCICKKPYNSRRFYISCNLCSGWFHGKCVNITKEQCSRLTSFECPSCQEEQKRINQSELYCICKKPYDDRMFYVGCDRCEDWFHPECVGITQQYAETIAEYLCPNCREVEVTSTAGYESANSEVSTSSNSAPPLSRNDYPKVWRLLEAITQHQMAWPFRDPIDIQKHPDYTEIIKKPMDLATIHTKLERLEYIKLRDFSRDMSLIFENAKMFNSKDNPIYICAITLQKIFEQNIHELKKEMTSRAIDRRKQSESQAPDSLDIDTDQLIDTVNLDNGQMDASNFDISQYI